MLNLNVSGKWLRKNVWGCFGLVIGLMLAPAFNAFADPTLKYSNVFSFDLNTTAAGVVEAQVSGTSYLYGTTTSTSKSYGGAIYRVGLNGGQPTVVYQLQDTDGYNPTAGLMVTTDPSDNKIYLYGATLYGPRVGNTLTAGTGTLYRVLLDGTNYQTLYTFSAFSDSTALSNADGAYPSFALIDGGDGYAYGVTKQGGDHGTGTVFRVKLDGTVFQVLHTFAALGSDGLNASGEGAYPSASLVLANGRLYGVTSGGGANKWTESSSTSNGVTSEVSAGTGTIFSLNTDGTDFQTIYNFSELDSTGTGRNPDGAVPKGALLLDAQSGLLIGTASLGGSPVDGTTIGYGTVFSVQTDDTPEGTTVTILHAFTGTDGSGPIDNLLAATDGLIYGVTGAGTNSSTTPYSAYGTVYSIDTTGNFNLAHGFTTGEVSSLTSGLIEASDGNFYGAAAYYGACTYYGAVYRVSLNGLTTSNPYASCTTTSSSGGGSMNGGLLWLLAALGLAPPVRRRVFGFN